MRILKPAAFALGLLVLFTISVFAQEDIEKKKNYLVLSGSGMYAVEIAHSVATYNYFVGGVGFEHMFGETWSVRIDAQPFFMAQGSDTDIYGVGLSHTWTKYFNRQDDFALYVSASAGMVFFQDVVPVENATQFNFTLGLGAGFDYHLSATDAIQIGYEYAHISNSNLGDRNPGINGHRGIIAWRHQF